ncbi:MAG: exonuclease SbcCD subunit D [Dehalococcoidales bacterium]|nr:exonuclease SbcCD subunit D [Dehalococcoidales bacterium]
MKIIHFADLHLGVENYGRINPVTGLSTRLEDFLKSFDELVDYAIDNRPDLVLFCGDAYKTREPTQTQQREFARRINRMATAGIPVFLLTGNHDMPNAVGRATATEIFDTLAVKNVTVASKPGIHIVSTAGGEIQIVALPWLRRSTLLSREDSKNLTLEEINRRLQQTLTDIISNLAGQVDPALPAILAAHVSISSATVGSESMMSIGQEHVLLKGTVANPAFDYVALGHIHKHQVLSDTSGGGPPVIYSGSLERVDFGEEKDEKGFYVVDITAAEDSGRCSVSYEFHPVNARRFQTVSVALAEDELDPTAAVLRTISGHRQDIGNAIVRLRIDLPSSLEGQLRDADIRDALKDAHFMTMTVAREAPAPPSNRRISATGQPTPLAALKAWLDTQEISEERRKELLAYGEKLLEEQ